MTHLKELGRVRVWPFEKETETVRSVPSAKALGGMGTVPTILMLVLRVIVTVTPPAMLTEEAPLRLTPPMIILQVLAASHLNGETSIK